MNYPYKTYDQFLSIRKQLHGTGSRDVFRLGASDVSTVFKSDGKIGLNKWKSPTVFFYECCDYVPFRDSYNLDMHRGKIQESINYSQYWRYYDPANTDAYLQNFQNKTVVRSATKANKIMVNPKYPWLAVSPDYIIKKSKISPNGSLEIKSTKSRTNYEWESGTDPSYVIQTQTQIVVGNWSYGELFDVEDCTYPKLYQFEYNKDIIGNILESTHEFCQKVLEGKKIVYSNLSRLEKEQALAELAPPDDGNPLYTDFLKEHHKPENAKITVDGDLDMFENVIDYLKMSRESEELERRITEKENTIREYFRDTDIGVIQFPEGKVSWRKKFTVHKSILTNYEKVTVWVNNL